MRGQRLQACLARNLRLRAPLRLIGKVQVLEACLRVRGLQGRRKLRRELSLLVDALENRRAPLLELAQVGQALLEGAEVRVVQPACRFLAIARDERDGGLVVEQRDGGVHLLDAYAELSGDTFGNGDHPG